MTLAEKRFAGAVALACVLGMTGSVVAMPPLSRAPAPQSDQAPGAAGVTLDGPLLQGGVVRGTVPRGTVRLTLDDVDVPIAPDGRFVIAFDRDAAARASLVVTTADGRRAVRTLSVAPRAWRLERLDRVARFTRPSAEFARVRPAEFAAIAAAWAKGSDSQGWRQRFRWPATGRISGLFGAQRIYRGEPGAYHSGVDVAKPSGATVVAPADGVVTLAAETPFTLEGHLLMIDHGMGLGSAFLHLSRIDVRVGDTVRQGQPIGRVGATGRASGPHLHWGMKWRGARVDPLLVAGPMNPEG